jgi:hypothetical protein
MWWDGAKFDRILFEDPDTGRLSPFAPVTKCPRMKRSKKKGPHTFMSFITPKEGWGITQSVPPRGVPPRSMPPQSVQNVPSFCGNCGRQLTAGPKFCTGCGAPTEEISLSRPPQHDFAAVITDYPKPHYQSYAPSHIFQPQITQQVTVIQAQQPRSRGLLFWLLFIPFWPIMLPIMIIGWIIELCQD